MMIESTPSPRAICRHKLCCILSALLLSPALVSVSLCVAEWPSWKDQLELSFILSIVHALLCLIALQSTLCSTSCFLPPPNVRTALFERLSHSAKVQGRSIRHSSRWQMFADKSGECADRGAEARMVKRCVCVCQWMQLECTRRPPGKVTQSFDSSSNASAASEASTI